MTHHQIGKWSATASFVACLGAGLLILQAHGFNLDDPLESGIGLYFIGKAFFVGPSLLLTAEATDKG